MGLEVLLSESYNNNQISVWTLGCDKSLSSVNGREGFRGYCVTLKGTQHKSLSLDEGQVLSVLSLVFLPEEEVGILTETEKFLPEIKKSRKSF